MLPYRDSRLVKIALVVFFLILIGYGYYEAQAILFGPRISVPNDAIHVREPFLRIRGKAANISELRLNGGTISVTEDGSFDEPFLATPGENRVVLDAVDRFGRKTQKSIEIIYEPIAPEQGTSTGEVAPQ